jgi:HSP20 family protein
MRSMDRLSWMWDEALSALEQAERRQRRFFGLIHSKAPLPVWEPPADVFESEAEVVVSIALPGVDAAAVRVEVVASGLLVRAERSPPPELASMRIHRIEIPYGTFERHVELAQGRYSVRERRMLDGCLTLRLAKE